MLTKAYILKITDEERHALLHLVSNERNRLLNAGKDAKPFNRLLAEVFGAKTRRVRLHYEDLL